MMKKVIVIVIGCLLLGCKRNTIDQDVRYSNQRWTVGTYVWQTYEPFDRDIVWSSFVWNVSDITKLDSIKKAEMNKGKKVLESLKDIEIQMKH